MIMPNSVKCPKKLIEVALPLDAINVAAAREKSIRHGHPSTLHLWWARRPLAAARAVIFGQTVNDPSWKWELEHPGEIPPNQMKANWAKNRKRLFEILEALVKWENTTNEEVLERARTEIRRSWRETCELNKDHPRAAELFNPERLPGFHDPFAGGGSIPLEAQRLGFEAYASDLNPVAVLINKAMIEIPPKFAGRPPVNREAREEKEALRTSWRGAQGLANDVRYYGQWMRDEAEKRIGHLYPKIEVTKEMVKERPDLKPLVGKKLTVIAWLWARTVKSPNPAFSHVDVPLASTFILSTKEGKEAYVEPVIEGGGYRFTVRVGKPKDNEAAKHGTKLARANFACMMSGTPVSGDHIKAEGKAGRMGARLMAIVAEGERGRVYLAPTPEHEAASLQAKPAWRPEGVIATRMTGGNCTPYGLTSWGDLFTPRQLVAMTMFSGLVSEAREKVCADAIAAGMANDGNGLDGGGSGVAAYADAIVVYLAFAVDKSSVYWTSLCPWLNQPKNEIVGNTFGRQALPMMWDYAEANPFSDSGGNIDKQVQYLSETMGLTLSGRVCGEAVQIDAAKQLACIDKVVSTDPPYYDNIGYADLSDFFYVWLRRALKPIFRNLFATLVVPKAEELVATAYRHGSKENAEAFFMNGMTQAMHRLAEQAHAAFPVTIYYAFKQSESESDGTVSTGWQTFLDAVIDAGFVLSGTWPMRTERPTALKTGSNALASSIVLVCRPRPAGAPCISRRQFLRELNQVLPEALDEMTKGSGDDRSPVAPVDLSQAIIGPGMAVFSKYSAVLEADGTPMSVRTALQLINKFLAEEDFDADTQFCLHWFEQHGWREGAFGEADNLARSKGVSVDGVKSAGVLESGGGKVRLLKWSEYPADWNPNTDGRLPVWEALHQFIRIFKSEGESGAGSLLASIAGLAEPARQLAYRLYTLCERAGWAEDARAYNELITSWSGIETTAAAIVARSRPEQLSLFDIEPTTPSERKRK